MKNKANDLVQRSEILVDKLKKLDEKVDKVGASLDQRLAMVENSNRKLAAALEVMEKAEVERKNKGRTTAEGS